MKEKMLLASLVLFGISIIFFALTFLVFHFLGKDGLLHKTFNKQAQKPFVANLFGMFSTFLFASSVVILVLALMVY